MRIARLIILAALSLTPATLRAQAPTGPAPYQRTRGGADQGQFRGGGPWRGGSPGSGGFGYGGIYNPYFAPAPIIAGSYYQRPYPYHFDYYRNRWSGQEQQTQSQGPPPVEMIPAADCPCLAAPGG